MKNPRNRPTAFTLLEVVIVILLLTILAASGARLSEMNDDANRFQDTLFRLEKVRDHLIGDESLLQSGRRADFGFFGETGDFPSDLDQLAWYWPFANPFFYAHDGWGQRYAFDGPSGTGGVLSITSPGSPRIGAGSFAQSISLSLRLADFTSNTVYIYCKDVNGTLLLPANASFANTATYHIWQVQLYANNGSFIFPGGALSASRNGYWVASGVKAGPCQVLVYPSDGSSGGGTQDWRPYLSSTALGQIELREVIYPKGGFPLNNENIIEIRFPGTVVGGPDLS